MAFDHDVKPASSWKIAGCACGRVHFLLCDEKGDIFAIADAPPDIARLAAAALLNAAAFVEELSEPEEASCH